MKICNNNYYYYNMISSLYLSLYRKLHTCVHSILRLSKTGKSAFSVIINKVVDNHKVVYIIIMHFNLFSNIMLVIVNFML